MNINFEEITKSILQRHGLTEGALAKLVGVKQPTIHRIKTGEIKMPRYRTAQKLIDIYDHGIDSAA